MGMKAKDVREQNRARSREQGGGNGSLVKLTDDEIEKIDAHKAKSDFLKNKKDVSDSISNYDIAYDKSDRKKHVYIVAHLKQDSHGAYRLADGKTIAQKIATGLTYNQFMNKYAKPGTKVDDDIEND